MTIPQAGLRPFGFDGPVDYIERITYGIWNLPNRQLDLIRRFYSSSTAIHLDVGDLVGDDVVVANTSARLRTFPDFNGVIDDTIWVGSEEEGYRTSMRWTWTGTDTGGTVYGPATGRPVTFTAIANCIVLGEVIIEEWLGANPLAQARQLGFGLEAAVAATRYPSVSGVAKPSFTFAPSPAGDFVKRAFVGALTGELDAGLFAVDCANEFAPDWKEAGVAVLVRWCARLREALSGITVEIDDQYFMPASAGHPLRVATQWRIGGVGPRGQVEVGLISHHHLEDERIFAQWLAFDELALAHQGVVLSRS